MCMAVYGIHEAKRSESGRASERVELSVLLGGGGEHLGVPFYRPRKRDCATGLFACLQWRCCGRMLAWMVEQLDNFPSNCT
jgi:hypothetical protein